MRLAQTDRMKAYPISQSAVLVLTIALVVITPTVWRSSATTAQPNIPYRSILAKVPPNIRTRFLQSLVFINGGLAGAYAGDIKATLPKAEYAMMLAHLGYGFGRLGEDHVGFECSRPGECKESSKYICDPGKCGSSSDGAITMGELLTTLPVNVSGEFLESLDFANGHLVGANVGGVRSRVTQAEFERLFARVTANQLKLKINGNYYKP